jgi:flagellin-specific chaperone FliS
MKTANIKTERIKVHFDQEGLNKLNENINHTTSVLTDLSNFMKEDLKLELTKDLALDVLYTGGRESLSLFNAAQSKQLDKAGMTGRMKEKLLKTAEGDLVSELLKFKEMLQNEGLNRYNPIDAMTYISIESGLPVINDKDTTAIHERFTTFAETDAHHELYEAHQAAVGALNSLRQVLRKHKPNMFFLGSLQFYSTFFEMDQKEEVFAPKPINYRLL